MSSLLSITSVAHALACQAYKQVVNISFLTLKTNYIIVYVCVNSNNILLTLI